MRLQLIRCLTLLAVTPSMMKMTNIAGDRLGGGLLTYVAERGNIVEGYNIVRSAEIEVTLLCVKEQLLQEVYWISFCLGEGVASDQALIGDKGASHRT